MRNQAKIQPLTADQAKLTRLDWTPQLIARFWNNMAALPIDEIASFARTASPLLIPLVERYLKRDARIIDYGAGYGHLTAELLARGYRTAAYEPSGSRTAMLLDRVGADPRFLGVVSDRDPGGYDALFCLEVVEHVMEPLLPAFFASLRGLLRDNGTVVLTCPSAEDLELSMAVCPVCEHAFHRWQHLRSVDYRDLADQFVEAGFAVVWQGLIGFEAGQEITELIAAQNAPGEFVYRPEVGLFVEGRRDQDPQYWASRGDHDVDVQIGSQRNIVFVGRKMAPGERPRTRYGGRRSRVRAEL